MWKKYYQIAERQFYAEKKTAEVHALKALKAAEETNNIEHIALTLSLLARIYFLSNNDLAESTLIRSIEKTKEAWGENCIKLIDEFKMLSCLYESKESFNLAESMLLQGLEVARICKDEQQLIHMLGFVSGFYFEYELFDKAHDYFLQTLQCKKEFYGATNSEVIDEVEFYQELLSKLGREEETESLSCIGAECEDCGVVHILNGFSPEIDSVIAEIRKLIRQPDLDKAINYIRNSLPAFKAHKYTETVKENDPFFELKKLAQSRPYNWAAFTQAQLLRAKYDLSGESSYLLEAEDYLKQLAKNSSTKGQFGVGTHLMLTLLDLCKIRNSAFEELEKMLVSQPKSAAV